MAADHANDHDEPEELDEQEQVTFDELAQIELDFDDVETQIIAQQYLLSQPLYAKRAQIISKIKHFWPLALESSPTDIDVWIQPTDSEVFASCLKDFSVTRFEIPSTATPTSPNLADYGNPRSVSFRFEFTENEWFEDQVIEKKFWWRRGNDGFEGLVSEPVQIKWKKGKDLSVGLIDAAIKLNNAVKKAGPDYDHSTLPAWKELEATMASTNEGQLSFFTWFGYVGRFITEQESKEAFRKQREKRDAARTGKGKVIDPDESGADGPLEVEIYPAGAEIAMELSDDFWPGAIKYFTTAQEEDLSDIEFEEGSDEDEDEDEDDDMAAPDLRQIVQNTPQSEGPPSKRRKT